MLPVVILGIMVVSIAFLPRPASEGTRLERTASIEARRNDIVESVQSFTPKTWGIGNGWYVTHARRQPQVGIEVSHSSSPGNSYIHIIESFGILGCAAFVYGVIRTLYITKGKDVFVSTALFLGVGSLFNNLLFYPWIIIVMMAITSYVFTEDR